jgi:hypothetical protein
MPNQHWVFEAVFREFGAGTLKGAVQLTAVALSGNVDRLGRNVLPFGAR